MRNTMLPCPPGERKRKSSREQCISGLPRVIRQPYRVIYRLDRENERHIYEKLGRGQEIEIGPMSGASDVTYWLRDRRLAASADVVSAVLAHAKSVDHVRSATKWTR
jgi:hypothetical protein